MRKRNEIWSTLKLEYVRFNTPTNQRIGYRSSSKVNMIAELERIRNIVPALPPPIIEIVIQPATTHQQLRISILNAIMPRINYFIKFRTFTGFIKFNTISRLSTTSPDRVFRDLTYRLNQLIDNPGEYDASLINGGLTLQLIKEVVVSPPLQNLRDGEINCGCLPVLEILKRKKQTKQIKKQIAEVEKINLQYFDGGINEEGLQLLADTSYINISIFDQSNKKWGEFKPKGNKKGARLLLTAHNGHLSSVIHNNRYVLEDQFLDLTKKIKWHDNQSEVAEIGRNNIGIPVLSRGELVAYQMEDFTHKLKFPEYLEYPKAFTSGGVGKHKFLEQFPEFKNGASEGALYQIALDANKSGFYMRSGLSSKTHTKYDANHAYKSFKSSGLFQGFPNIQAVFKVEKLFDDQFSSRTKQGLKNMEGLLYIEFPTLTFDNCDQIYYEGDGWYPFEIVQKYYENYGVNPFVKSYAYANTSFNVDFSKFTNDQFRTFAGKCFSTTSASTWRTRDSTEFLRAVYVLGDKILRVDTEFCENTQKEYVITYTTDRKPWNFPIISAYIKAHQKYNLFEQYNKLRKNGIMPIAISVDGIEVKDKCDNLFDIGISEGQWKLEDVYCNGEFEKSVIERVIAAPVSPKAKQPTVEFSDDYILPKYLHISGSGGNGKTQHIVNYQKCYERLLYCASTTNAAKGLERRGNQLNLPLTAFTYHRVFGIGCRDTFPRWKYDGFLLDEASMLSAEHLTKIKNLLEPHQFLIISGDFWQLEPVSTPDSRATPLYNTWTGLRHPAYECFVEWELKENWRQKKDPKYFKLCESVRNKLTLKEVHNLIDKLNTRVISKKLKKPSNNTLDDMHICGTNSLVNLVNKKYKMKKGTKIICNTKCYDSKKVMIANGELGIIMENKPDDFRVKWEDGTISKFKSIGHSKNNKPRFSPAYALTIHKAQGRTVKKSLIIDPTKLFNRNHLYVALSRATSLKNIYLTEKLSIHMLRRTIRISESIEDMEINYDQPMSIHDL
jgi:hypothetical protein